MNVETKRLGERDRQMDGRTERMILRMTSEQDNDQMMDVCCRGKCLVMMMNEAFDDVCKKTVESDEN